MRPREDFYAGGKPTTTGYGEAATFERSQRLAPQAFPDLVLIVDDLLG